MSHEFRSPRLHWAEVSSVWRLTCVTFLSWQCDNLWRMTGRQDASLTANTKSQRKCQIKICTELCLASEAVTAAIQAVIQAVWPYWYVCTVRWTLYIGILRYWLCDHAPSVAASLMFGLQTLGGGEDNKDVIRWCLMVTIIQTSWPLTPASQWWHSWLSSQPLSEWLECDLFIVDMILFVSEVSPSQWVTSTSVTGCVTAAF